MYKHLTVLGMVLAASAVGDYDKRIVILTRERGKIHAFARGAKKPGNPFLAASQPFSFGEFDLIEGRSAYNIVGVRISNYFQELRSDITFVCYGLYFCEFADYMTREGSDERNVLKLLYQSLRAVVKPQIGTELVRYIFDLRMVYINGEGPQVFECVKCGSREGQMFFSAKAGGSICRECLAAAQDAEPVSNTALYTMQYILSQPIEKLYTFTVTENILEELGRIVRIYVQTYIGHEMKSLDMLEKL